LFSPIGAAEQTELRTPADRFVEHLEGTVTAPPEAVELIRNAWAKCEDCDGDEFLTQALTLFHTEFRDGLDAYFADRYDVCATTMGALRHHEDPFLAVHAAVYEIKALVALDRMKEALERIEPLLDEKAGGREQVRTFSHLAPEVAFLHGHCLLANLLYTDAAHALGQFLDAYPDAPQRLRIAAQQMLAELQNRRPGRIGEVVDLMKFSARRLTLADSGNAVQEKQERIVDILNNLIEEAEEQENASCNSGSSKSGGRPNSSTPMPDSRLPGTRAAEGTLRETRRANPGDVWGGMQPAERERILQALRESFPNRYRHLVEQYYEQLAKEP
jgi:hypothetical protein